MTGKEIEVLAAKNAPLPDGLDVPERYLFLCLRSLYAQFRAGTAAGKTGKDGDRKWIRIIPAAVEDHATGYADPAGGAADR